MRADRGVTLVELLIAIGVVGLVLSVVSAFFIFQSRTTTRVQGSNEVNVRIRAVAEMAVKDLQLTGGQAVVVGGIPSYINQVRLVCDPPVDADGNPDPAGEPDGTNADCVTVDATTGDVTMVYASSLWPAGQRCRKVSYHFDAATSALHRADVGCDEALPTSWSFDTEVATGLSTFGMTFTCELIDTDGDDVPDTRQVVDDPRACYDAESYVRSGTVSVEGASGRPIATTRSLSLTTNMPNVRNPIDFGDGS